MTYNVFDGTLKLTQSINRLCDSSCAQWQFLIGGRNSSRFLSAKWLSEKVRPL